MSAEVILNHSMLAAESEMDCERKRWKELMLNINTKMDHLVAIHNYIIGLKYDLCEMLETFHFSDHKTKETNETISVIQQVIHTLKHKLRN